MNPFDPNFKGQIPTPSRKERWYQRTARKMSERQQAVLDRDGPTKAITQAQRTEAALKTARVQKVSGI